MTTPADVLTEAQRWLGTSEQPRGSNNVPGVTDWYGMRGAWCAMWVSRVFWNAGLPLPASTPKGFAWCSAGADWFRAQGRTHPSRDARPGDVLFFEWGTGAAGGYDHTGICVANDGNGLSTIEGNTSDAVRMHRRSYGEVPEVGRPAFTEPAPPPPPRKEPKMIATCLTPDGTSVVEFFVNGFGYVTHRWYGANGWGDYTPVNVDQPGSFDSVEAWRWPDGRLEVLCYHSAYRVPFRCWQVAPGGAWSSWQRA
jgi:hypothetical protein